MDLAVGKREQLGKQVRTLRKKNLIPAELYGHGSENLHLAVKRPDFEKVFKATGESTLINLLFDNEKRPALIYNVQKDYLSGDIIHIDFYQVRMDEKIRTHVPVEFIGEAPAVKEKSGILNKSVSEVEVEALPADLPHHLSVDLSSLVELEQSLYVKDLKVPDRVKILVEPETVLATVTPPLAEEKVEAPVEVSEVKVEAEEKVAERQAERTKESKDAAS